MSHYNTQEHTNSYNKIREKLYLVVVHDSLNFSLVWIPHGLVCSWVLSKRI
jgi:hypothetical protein